MDRFLALLVLLWIVVELGSCFAGIHALYFKGFKLKKAKKKGGGGFTSENNSYTTFHTTDVFHPLYLLHFIVENY